MSVPESKENMIGCQGYTKWCAEDEGSVVDLLDDEVQPVRSSLSFILMRLGPLTDLLTVFLMTQITRSTAPIP